MADFEPVEIDFMYGGNTQAEGARIIKTTEEIAAAQAKAKADVERHSNAIMELKKDLVGLGTAYKQAMSKQQKSEILTEIELTKKNIIDETQAIKVLKAEIASMNKMPRSAAVPDATQVGKVAVGYSSLNYSTQQLVRELPAATMGLNMFFLAISNNIPVLTDGIKRARAENEALKASGASATPVWKQLLSSLVSWQSAMMIGITIFALYGKDIAAWVGELFTGEKAVKKLTDAQLGLTRANETMIASLKSGSEYKTAVTNIEKLSAALRQAKGNHELEKKAVDDYNGSLGETFGKAKNVDEALGMIARNKDAYIKAMQDMSFANAFFAKSADDAMKAMEVGLKSQQQILKESGADNIGLFEKWQAAVKETEDAKKKLDSMKAEGKDTFYTEKYYQSRLNNQNIFARQIQELEAKERARQLAAIRKHQEESLKLANNYYNSYTDIFKQNDWEAVVKEGKGKEAKQTYDSESAITDLILDLKAQRSKMLNDADADSLQKRLNAIDMEEAAEIRKIQEKEAAIVEAYNKSHKGEAGFTAKTTLAEVDPTLAAKLSAEKDGISSAFDQKRIAAAEKWKNELLQLAQRYGDESARIEAEYNTRIQKLAQSGFIIQAAELTKERDERLSALETSLIKETELYKMASDATLKLTKELNEKLIAEAKTRINSDPTLSDDDKARLIAKIDESGAQRAVSGVMKLADAFIKLKKAKDDMASAKANGDALGFAKASKEVDELKGKLEKMANSMLDAFDAISSGLIDSLDQLGLLTSEEKKGAQEISGMLSGAGDLAMGLATGNYMQAISGGISLITNAISFFDKNTKDIERKQKQAEQNINNLTAAYEKLQRAVDDALGTDVYKAQRDQVANLQKQIQEYYSLIELEQRKKKKKQDAEKIANWKAEIENLKGQVGDVTDAITEALAQTNVKDLAGELSDALVNAFASGESAAESMGKVVDNVLRNAVVNALKLKVLDKLLAPAIDVFAADMESGGQLTGSEAGKFRDAVTAAGEAYFKALNEANEALGGIFNGDAASATGIKGDIAKMTEETGSALVGQITALRFNVAGLLANSKSSLDQVSRALDLLGDIRSNTDRLQRIDETLYYLKINGIKVN